MKRNQPRPSPRDTAVTSHARGVTLIELMVGLAIGLLATLVIAQVLTVSEGRRRTTVSGSDAQVSGSLALYSVQREVEMSGYGVTTAVAGLGCPIKAQKNGVDYTFTLAPLLITQGANGAPDTLQMMGSAKLSFSVPARVVVDHPRTAANFFVNTTLGAQVGDLMIAVPAGLALGRLQLRWRGAIMLVFLLPSAFPNLPVYVNIARVFYELRLAGTIPGVVLVHDRLAKILEREGLQAIRPQGERFDPELHDAIAQLPIPGAEPGTIVEVAVPGYRYRDRVLRHAKVVVAAERDAATEGSAGASRGAAGPDPGESGGGL